MWCCGRRARFQASGGQEGGSDERRGEAEEVEGDEEELVEGAGCEEDGLVDCTLGVSSCNIILPVWYILR